MRNAHPRYMCFPSVVCVGRPTHVTITPRDTSRIFREEKSFEMCVIGMRDDMVDYHDKLPMDVPCYVSGGCLHFDYTFEREQEYSIRFCEKGGKPIKISLYAVQEDLYVRRPLKGDLHTHSYYSDGQDGVAMVPACYREEGFDFYALTDHNRMFTSTIQSEQYEGVKLGVCMLKGEEVHTPGSSVHIVHIGGNFSVCERYVKEPEAFVAEVAEIEKTLTHIPEQYRLRVAQATWACREIKRAGGISIFAHPFWTANVYNVSEDFCNYLFDEKIFDVFELHNDGATHRDNLQLALWQEQALKGNVLPVVGNSDSHNHDFATTGFGRSFTIAFARDNTEEAIIEALRDGYSVAAEVPRKNDAEIRVFGSQFRLVQFARFLYENYFNETWRLCVGEGILMRRYAEGEEVGETLSALADTVENHYKKFFGLVPAPTLSPRVLGYLEKVRIAQIDSGIITKGSHLDLYGGNERRE
ncbi:MAG: CehA/McbA family metallohydrolase [Clostridia bacterium]|nr:CehA/McbA family metallohydrolase [Clostridia bacterium]